MPPEAHRRLARSIAVPLVLSEEDSAVAVKPRAASISDRSRSEYASSLDQGLHGDFRSRISGVH